MPDLFDQIHSQVTGQPPAQGDIFDQIHAHASAFQGDQTTPLPQGTEGSVPQAQADETARRRAANEISDRQTGRSFTKTAGPDGTAEYHYDIPAPNPATWRASTAPAQPLSDPQKLAIYQAQNQQVGGRPMQTQDFGQMAGQVRQASTEQNTPIENFGGGLAGALSAPVVGATGLANPRAGQQMQEDVAGAYANDPDSKASLAGRIVGGTVVAAPAILAGGGGTYAALMATQAAGDARMEVAQMRQQGQQISPEQETAYVLNKALIAGATSKISAGAMTSGKGIMNAAATGAADIGASQIAGNAAAIGTGVDPNRTLGEGASGAMLEGGLGAAAGHAVHGLLPEQKPNIGKQVPNEKPGGGSTPDGENRVRETGLVPEKVDVEQLPAGGKGVDAASNPPEVSNPTPAPESAAPTQPEAKSEHPTELPDAKAVGEWYGKTFQDPENAQVIEAMTSQHPGKYKLVDVPLDKVDPNSVLSSDNNQAKLDALKTLSPEDRAKLPPVIAVGDADHLMVADGSHRVKAAQEAGDKTIKAYVPEETANKFAAPEPKSLKETLDAAFAEGDAKLAAEDKAHAAGKTQFDWMDTTSPKPTPRKGLEKIEGMEDMTYQQLKNKAKGLGYDTTGKMNFSSVRRAVESQHADSQINLPRPPKSAKDWSAKQYSHWAKESGYKVTDTDNRYEVARQITAQRKNALREVAGKNPKAYTPKPPAAVEAGPKAPSAETKTHAPAGYEYYATPIIRQMEDINKPLAGKVFEANFEGRRQGAEWQATLDPHIQALKSEFKSKDTFPFQKAVYEGDIEKAKSLVPEKLAPAVDALFESSKTALAYRKSVGAETPAIKNHVHFEVKDYKGLQKAMEKEPSGPIKEAWDAELARTGRPLTEQRKIEIANSVLNGFGPRVSAGKAGFKKERGANFTRATEKFYKPVWESQHDYLMKASEDAQLTKLLGKDYTETVQGPNEKNAAAIQNTSLGKLITQEVNSGRLTGEGAAKFKDLLSAHIGSKTASDAIKTTRDIINFATLTHIGTAIKQLGDIGFTAYKYGVKNAAKGTKLSITKSDQNVMAKELGIDDVSHEMRDSGKLGNAVSKWMRYTGMMKFDVLAKETRATAAILDHQQKIKTPAGEDAFAKEYKSFLGDKYNQTVADLKEGKRTWNTDLLAAHELSKSQPIYRVNMTPGQAKSEGIGRLAYSLKPFMLHQLDTVRREIARNLATPGTRKQGLKNMAGMVGALSLANLGTGAITNLMNGKDADMTEQAADSVLGIANLSSYAVKNGVKDPGGFILKFIGPPTPILGDVAHDLRGDMFKGQTKRVFKDGKWSDEKTSKFQGSAIVRDLPHLIGTIAYYWTPLGAGYHQEADAAKKDYRDKLTELKKSAEDADASGDEDMAKFLIDTYNQQAAKDPDKKVKAISGGTIQRAKQTSMNSQRKAHAAQSK